MGSFSRLLPLIKKSLTAATKDIELEIRQNITQIMNDTKRGYNFNPSPFLPYYRKKAITQGYLWFEYGNISTGSGE